MAAVANCHPGNATEPFRVANRPRHLIQCYNAALQWGRNNVEEGRSSHKFLPHCKLALQSQESKFHLRSNKRWQTPFHDNTAHAWAYPGAAQQTADEPSSTLVARFWSTATRISTTTLHALLVKDQHDAWGHPVAPPSTSRNTSTDWRNNYSSTHLCGTPIEQDQKKRGRILHRSTATTWRNWKNFGAPGAVKHEEKKKKKKNTKELGIRAARPLSNKFFFFFFLPLLLLLIFLFVHILCVYIYLSICIFKHY